MRQGRSQVCGGGGERDAHSPVLGLIAPAGRGPVGTLGRESAEVAPSGRGVISYLFVGARSGTHNHDLSIPLSDERAPVAPLGIQRPSGLPMPS